MNGPNLMQFAMNMLKQNPNVARNPQAQAMLQVLQSGDAQKGQQIAQNLCQTYGIQNSITQMGIAQMQDTNAISRQLADCCCENRQGQADIKYAMATDTCAITTAINQAAQQIMQNDNANYLRFRCRPRTPRFRSRLS